ncbi:proteasome subunit alpha type-2-like [Scaptodrosophila lebanonensis]|uniref:Proteasome subunit alpha type-2-like n=1 Tax=Drosophila lebanonensis TaxID=7225 RepID=A0A6J2U372_DROLE|nr:proteasome subunit alpha type-2-like [Scaptodrosophila lebanonensis]
MAMYDYGYGYRYEPERSGPEEQHQNQLKIKIKMIDNRHANGYLLQVEYATVAASKGETSVGIRACDGVVIATERRFQLGLVDEATLQNAKKVSENIGITYSGLEPDFRVLVDRARKYAEVYRVKYDELMPAFELVKQMGTLLQEYTQSCGVRPFGMFLLYAGWESGGPFLYRTDPSGAYCALNAAAFGKNAAIANEFLKCQACDEMKLDVAVCTAIMALKKGFKGNLSKHDIEVGVCHENGFSLLDANTIEIHLNTLFD